MIARHNLSHEQAKAAVDSNSFSQDLLASDDFVVLILTQSWCPQWQFMKTSLNGLGDGPEDLSISIYSYEYDRSPYFHTFMAFKENVFRNWEVPYVRIYNKGRFIAESNAVPAGRLIMQIREASGS